MSTLIHAAPSDGHYAQQPTYEAYTRYTSYSQHHLANYASQSQRSVAFFGTVPRDSLEPDASYVDAAQYQQPEALPSGLVAPAEDYTMYQQPEAAWADHASDGSSSRFGRIPLTPVAMAYLAAQQDTTPTHPTSITDNGLHIDTNMSYSQEYTSCSAHSTPPLSVYTTPMYSPLATSYFHQYAMTTATSTVASPMDPGDQPFVFPPGHPAAASITGPASHQGCPTSSELAHWNAGYDESSASTAIIALPSAPLVVPTPRTPVTEDVRARLERYASDSPHAYLDEHHVDNADLWAEADTYWATHSHASVGFAEHFRPGGEASAMHSPTGCYYEAPPSPMAIAPRDLDAVAAAHYVAAQQAAEQQQQLESAGGADRGRKRRKRTPEPRKPLVMACLFCRGRKIACGAPPSGSSDRSCDQCKRRNQPCEYPTVYRRGQRRPRADEEGPLDIAPAPTDDFAEGSGKDSIKLENPHGSSPVRLAHHLAPLPLAPGPISPSQKTARSLAIKFKHEHDASRML